MTTELAGLEQRLLGRQPWTDHPARLVVLPAEGYGDTMLVLLDEHDQPHAFSVGTWIWRWEGFEAYDGKTVWFAGALRRGGVAAPPGADRLFWVQRARGQRERGALEATTRGGARSTASR